MPRPPRLATPPAFFLSSPPGETPAQLVPEDVEHARRVLRMRPGDLLLGLDGHGHRWPLRIRSIGPNEVQLDPAGNVESAPAPGEIGSTYPWFEVAVSWPRRSREAEMVARLVQLGVSAILPMAAVQRGPETITEGTPERLLRLARESCKQCGRTWMPCFEEARAPVELARARRHGVLALFDPRGGMAFDTWLRSLHPSPGGIGTRERPIVLVIGPEGGFTDEERAAFLDAAATTVWVGPHVLRIETAAEAAMAVAAAVHARRPEPARDDGTY